MDSLISIAAQAAIAGSVSFITAACAAGDNIECSLKRMGKQLFILKALYMPGSARCRIVKHKAIAICARYRIFKALQAAVDILFFDIERQADAAEHGVQNAERLIMLPELKRHIDHMQLEYVRLKAVSQRKAP